MSCWPFTSSVGAATFRSGHEEIIDEQRQEIEARGREVEIRYVSYAKRIKKDFKWLALIGNLTKLSIFTGIVCGWLWVFSPQFEQISNVDVFHMVWASLGLASNVLQALQNTRNYEEMEVQWAVAFWHVPSGKHTKSYWKWPFIVSFPIKNGDFP